MTEIQNKSIKKNISENVSENFELNNFFEKCQIILGDETFTKWFTNTNIVSSSINEIVISSPSKLNRDWINREFFSKKSFITKLKEFYPKLLKVSVVYIANQTNNLETLNQSIPNNSPKISKNNSTQNIVNLSKLDNIFAYGTELNPKFTFQNFISAKHNKIALSMAKIVAGCSDTPQLFDDKIPLFIHGNVGMGKTHLAQAIAWNIKDNNSNKKVVYLSAEKFMFHFVQSIRNNEIMSFKEKMRSIDVLIVDDVQFIAGKDSTQQEFMNCFNSLVEDNKQVVLVCDRCPTALENIDEKLKSRITGGMIVNFKNPDFADRLAILKGKSQQLNFEISDEILNYLATHLKGSNRDLEGAIKKIYAEKMFEDTEINLTIVKSLLNNYFKTPSNQKISIDKIQKIVAEFYDLKISDLLSKNRSKNIANARQIAMYLCKKLTQENLKNIGDKFNKNHATVIHSFKLISEIENKCPKTAQEIKIIEEKLA
jgi:chromosomal replication initiator protein